MIPQLGEGFEGEGSHVAHINTVLGLRDGPVGQAWATSLAMPSAGHTRFVVVRQPNQPILPMTVFVNKATIDSDRHATLTWGAVQSGVVKGVDRAVNDGVIQGNLHLLALIVAVWVDPKADDADILEINNDVATYRALVQGAAPFES
jgi:5,6,7,8-tetrahydromethanopterin hydro-lyase